jgi:hypothetical protein
MAASGRGSVVVGYNVQTAVDTMGAVQRSASKQSPAASD